LTEILEPSAGNRPTTHQQRHVQLESRGLQGVDGAELSPVELNNRNSSAQKGTEFNPFRSTQQFDQGIRVNTPTHQACKSHQHTEY
jgi:hypothetical protein